MRFHHPFFIALTAATFLCASTLAGAGELPKDVAAPLPGALQQLVSSGKAKVQKHFSTAVPGVTGYVVRHGKGEDVVYGVNGYLFIGRFLSPKGDDLSAKYEDEYLPKPDYSAAIAKIESHGHLIVEGAASAPALYAFVDPDCIFCYHLWKQTRAIVGAGKLQMRWIVVGFLKASSAARAAAILGAKDPLKALHQDYAHFDPGHEEGGEPPAKKPAKKIQAVIHAHFETMRSLGGNGTPTLLYRNASGKWAMKVGLPSPAWIKAQAEGRSGAVKAAAK